MEQRRLPFSFGLVSALVKIQADYSQFGVLNAGGNGDVRGVRVVAQVTLRQFMAWIDDSGERVDTRLASIPGEVEHGLLSGQEVHAPFVQRRAVRIDGDQHIGDGGAVIAANRDLCSDISPARG